MAWTGKVEAKDLIGLSKEELEAKITEINTGLAKVSTLETQNTTLQNDVTTIKASLAALEGRPAVAPVVAATTTNDPPYDWSENADDAFNHRVAPIVRETLETKAIIVFDQIQRELSAKDPVYNLLSSDVRAFIDKECGNNLQAKAAPNVIRNAFKIIYADKIEEIQRDKAAKSGKFFTETGTNQVATQNNSNDPVKNLTEAEKAQAAKFGMSPEKYAESKATMTIVH